MPQFYHPTPFYRLKTIFHFSFCLAASILLQACSRSSSQSSPPPNPAATVVTQSPPPPAAGAINPAPAAPSPATTATIQTLPPLDQLLAPVALYPDPLIALLLPASAYPADLQAAASFLAANNDPSQIAGQPWNDSVKDLAHYPEVVQWMNSNPEWTQQVGSAFANSPTDVMNAIQDLRARAKAAGTLTDTPQQAIVDDGDDIDIEPAQPDVIYVPRYDPDAVYFGEAGGYYGGPFFTYGSPYPMGIWLGFDFDWHNHALWAGNWYQWRRDNGGWRQPFNPARAHFAASVNAHAWRPPANAARAMAAGASGLHANFARPRPMSGAPQLRRRAPAPNERVNQGPPVRPTPAPELRPEEMRGAPASRTAAPPERGVERAAEPERASRPEREPERAQEMRGPARESEHAQPANREAAPRKDAPPDDNRRKDN